MKILTPYKQFADSRGSFSGLTNSGTWEEFNYLETNAGEVRGGHYHKESLELFYIIDGELDIQITDLNHVIVAEHSVKRGAIILIEPFEFHTFTCRTECRWINVLSKKIDGRAPDIFT